MIRLGWGGEDHKNAYVVYMHWTITGDDFVAVESLYAYPNTQ